ncbi:winged helix-turn-helix domain-containing protein [Rhizobium acaciae]|uniref:winged helix-turn-helix domain-containing protein n=1 Tax=Rhizobium acaciae TaxID=2989736 RepID=UPI0022211794|nr:winged helix-turn-helix domain-containing protein [Rhizobium acaciae]
MILALKSAGDLACNLGSNLDGMELSLRVLHSPNAGRLIDAASVKEVDQVCGNVLVFTEDLDIDFSLIDRLVHSCDGNLVVAGNEHSRGSLRLLTNKALRLTATLPNCPVDGENVAADFSPLGIYRFETTFLRSVARNRPHRSNDDVEFFEAALGLQTHKIYLIHGETIVRKAEANDCKIVITSNTVASASEQCSLVSANNTRKLLTFLDLELDMNSYRVRRNGRIVHLTPTGFRLLSHLMEEPHRVYSRDELKSAVWPETIHVGPRTVDVHIGHLRAALNKVGRQDFVRTVRSVGYALSE